MARTLFSRSACAPLLAVLGLLGCSTSTSSDTTLGGVSKIVYAVRQNTTMNADGSVTIDVASGMGQVMDYGRYNPGGKLETYDLKSGAYDNITEDYPTADISSVDVSFDATKVVFTMKTDSSATYHVYWAGVDRGANGKFEVHQLTFGAYDDQNAIFAPGGRIVFTTNERYTEMGTRADEYEHAAVVTQLASISLTGGDADRKLCPQNLSHIVTLFPMHDGRVGFSRWEHLENVNDVKVFAMNPDCTQIVAVSGQHGKPGNSVVQVSESNTPNVFYGIVTNRENTIQAGSLVQIDARSSTVAGQFDEEKTETEAYSLLTPWVPTDDSPSPAGRYRSPSQLPDGRILVSWAGGVVNQINELSLTPPDYGVYVFDAANGNIPIADHAGTWELYAHAVAVRTEPPVIPTRNDIVDSSMPVRFGSINVHETSLASRHGETVSGAEFSNTPTDQALLGATKVRIIEGFSTESAAGVTMFGLTMAEGAAIVGEATVASDGSWLADLPPYIPMHLQPLDEFDMSIRSQTTWVQGLPGEDRVCGGCHEDRNAAIVPNGQALTISGSRGPENFMKPISARTEYPWAAANDASNPNQIQTLLTAKCVSCHNDTQNGSSAQTFYTVTMNNALAGTSTPYQIPRFDMSETPVTVVYDRKTHTWPSSYVSIFYPAALSMEMGQGATVTGTVPPKWGVPSDARNSAMIEKLNINSSLMGSETKFAWPLGQPFSDVNIAGGTRTNHAVDVAGLTRDEVVMLIRAIDMGGQYFARQNSMFSPIAADADPVAPKQF
ncbi:MAG TPA: hypothetical protein VGI10_20485 [Polyangiaceae bacterium]|jgi:hypothetical protein